MSYAQSPFGDGSASGSGNVVTTVNNHYGTRDSKYANGIVKTEGYSSTLTLAIDHVQATADAFQLNAPVLPAGARVTKVIMVTKVQGVAGTSAVLDIGTDSSESTNGFTITEAQMDAAAGTVVDLTGALSGTWDAEKELAADTTLGINLSVQTLTAGEYDIMISYDVARA